MYPNPMGVAFAFRFEEYTTYMQGSNCGEWHSPCIFGGETPFP